MMNYCITMERVVRTCVSFEAGSDAQAEEKATEIYNGMKPEDFEDGVEERDYALAETDTGRLILDWK